MIGVVLRMREGSVENAGRECKTGSSGMVLGGKGEKGKGLRVVVEWGRLGDINQK